MKLAYASDVKQCQFRLIDMPVVHRMFISHDPALRNRLCLPRWVKHDFWRQSQPQHDRAKKATVEKLIEVVDADINLTEKTNKGYKGWRS